LFGTRVAETILASVHVRAHQQAGHMGASDLIKSLHKNLAGRGPFSNRVSLVKPKMSAFQPSFHCQSLRDETSLVLRPPRFPAGLGRNGPSMASKQASLRSTRGQAPKPRSGAPQAPGLRSVDRRENNLICRPMPATSDMSEQ
jgi:hypothetical protein